MKTLTNIDLFPVLTLRPFDFGEESYPFNGPVDEETQYQYWKQILIKNALPTLEPVQKGMHFVRVREVDDASLEKLIELFMHDIAEYECSPDESSTTVDKDAEITPMSFEGGVVLTSNDQLIMTPQCCVSLQDHREWLGITKSDVFQRIWIGHPWVYYLTKDDQILFTRLIEKSFDGKTWKHYHTLDNTTMMDSSNCVEKLKEEIDQEDIKYAIPFQEMQKAIAAMKAEVDQFKQRAEKILEQQGVKNPAKVACCLVDGNGITFSYDETAF